MNILVVPTNRGKSAIEKFLADWRNEPWDKIIIVEDSPEKTFSLHEIDSLHYSWQEIDQAMGENAWIFSKKDSAIRCFGFYQAWTLGAKTIFTLDDDTRPCEPLISRHLNKLQEHAKWLELIPGMHTRGIPYRNRGLLRNVVANVGLWTNVPDLDAPHSLISPITDFTPPFYVDRIAPAGQYFPMTGMNLSFKSEATPLFYFPLMGQGCPFSRFDDIFAGIIAKKVADHLNLLISIGHPFVKHEKASNPFDNLIKEAPGIKANESFWEEIDRLKLSESEPAACMREIGEQLAGKKDAYLAKLGQAVVIWASLFR